MYIHFSTTFGFENVYPRLAGKAEQYIHGHMYAGEKGFLEYLEMHLGLQYDDVKDAIRISYYKKAVAQALEQDANLYISNSFQKDEWATAKQLLSWRDQLQMGLWDFKCDDPDLSRLYTISAIEQFSTDLPLGVNDRWRIIYDALRDWKYTLPMHTIEIYEPLSSIHPFYNRLFDLLAHMGVKLIWSNTMEDITEDSDLSLFKKKLSSPFKTKTEAKGDGSLLILSADNERLIADTLGEWLMYDKQAKPLFVIPNRGEILEQSLVNRGMPAFGYTSSYSDSAFDQLMSLITLFIWEPVDPEKIVQYLTLPNAPLPSELRTNLAQAYADKAGIGNEKWNRAIDKYLENHSDKTASVNHQLATWFGRKRYNVEEGTAIENIIHLYQDLKKWADAQLPNMEEDNSKKAPLQKLSNQCDSLIQLLKIEDKKDKKVKPIHLDRWLNAIESDSQHKSNIEEKGAYNYVLHPANVTKETDTIIYWNFLDDGNPISKSANWKTSELSFLKDVLVQTNHQMLDQWYWQMSNAVHKANKKLILCIPDASQGEEKEPNPLYHDLAATFKSLVNITKHINLNEDEIDLGYTKIGLSVYKEQSLPERKVKWDINPSKLLVKREYESFSSMSKLFYYPYAYVLNYLLYIKPFEIPEITINARLKGNLAHKTAEKLWQIEDILKLSDEELKASIEKVFDKVIDEEGDIFKLPKNKVSLMAFKMHVSTSLHHLFKSIKANGWRFKETEQKHEFKDQFNISGYIDLILIRGVDEIAIVDLKWGGLSAKKKELLQDNELQLIVYDRLMKAGYSKIHLHYYIITAQKFISRTNAAFKDAIVIASDEEEIVHRRTIWNKMVNTYEERWRQIDNGEIEVGDGMSEEELQDAFEMWTNHTCLSMPVTSKKKDEDKYSNYNNIIGSI